MNKRVKSLAGGAAGMTMLLAIPNTGLGSGPASDGPCASVPPDLALVVPHAGGIAVTRASGLETLEVGLPSAPTVAVRGPDGTVWAQVGAGGPTVDVHRIPAEGAAAMSRSGPVMLSAGGALDGRAAAVIIDRGLPEGDAEHGSVVVEFADGEQVDVKPAGGPEYGAVSVTIGAGRLVEGAWTDLTEAFEYYGLDGAWNDDWYSPTAAATYNAPPRYLWPAAAAGTDPNTASLSWVEGPDWDGATGQVAGGWALVVADAVTGAETLRLDLGDPGTVLMHADFDGRHWVGSFDADVEAADGDRVADRVVVVDTAAEQPTGVDAGCAAGVVATIDRLGVWPPPASTPPAAPPATTAAPTTAAPTTAPPVCPTYEPNDRYPLRLCDEGAAVAQVQRALVAAGHQLDVDGYFGPRTEEEVRRFQQAHGLEVDGLVGPDTWATLVLPFAPPSGADADGSGVVDPWELTAAAPVAPDYVGLVFPSPDVGGGIVDTSGRPVVGVTSQGGWVVGDIDQLPIYAVGHVVTPGGEMLWFKRAPGRDESGAVLPWTVVDTLTVPAMGPTDYLATLCTVAGVLADDVTGVVDYESPELEVQATAAWRFDIASESIVALDPATVTCQIEGR